MFLHTKQRKELVAKDRQDAVKTKSTRFNIKHYFLKNCKQGKLTYLKKKASPTVSKISTKIHAVVIVATLKTA